MLEVDFSQVNKKSHLLQECHLADLATPSSAGRHLISWGDGFISGTSSGTIEEIGIKAMRWHFILANMYLTGTNVEY